MLTQARDGAIAALTLDYPARRSGSGWSIMSRQGWGREVQSSLFMTADHGEGRTAFLETRAPSFSGR